MTWGEIPQSEWVHIFIHTLDVIPMNLYLEMEMQHETADYDEMKDIFLLTFSFEDRFECIDEALQEIKETIFRTLVEPITWIQPYWSTILWKREMTIRGILISLSERDNMKLLDVMPISLISHNGCAQKS